MPDQNKIIIDAARQSFNEELLSDDYPRIHHDYDQVDRLVSWLDPRSGGTYLDLATGNGIVAFGVADRQPNARIIGIDIADQALEQNQAVASENAYVNIEFRQTNGLAIDFPDAVFNGVACRFALHHFPDVDAVLADTNRVLKPNGNFVIADAVRHSNDDHDFINRFQSVKPDGHVKIYTDKNLIQMFRDHGFQVASQFATAINFARKLNPVYRRLLDQTSSETLALYNVELSRDQIMLTFEIQNFKLVKTAA